MQVSIFLKGMFTRWLELGKSVSPTMFPPVYITDIKDILSSSLLHTQVNDINKPILIHVQNVFFP